MSGYLFVAVGLAVTRWPLLVHHDEPWPTMHGVVTCMLVAMSVLAFLGVRHPLQMLPLLLFESAWKLIWLSVVALPAVMAGDVDEAMSQVIFSCSLVIIILAVIPWRYVWQRYVTAKGDRWRGSAA